MGICGPLFLHPVMHKDVTVIRIMIVAKHKLYFAVFRRRNDVETTVSENE